MANNNSGKNEKDLVCSFCGKHQDEVERMIIGPGVNICSECIGLCHDLLSDKPDQPKSARVYWPYDRPVLAAVARDAAVDASSAAVRAGDGDVHAVYRHEYHYPGRSDR